MKFYQRYPSGFFLTSRPPEISCFDSLIKQTESISSRPGSRTGRYGIRKKETGPDETVPLLNSSDYQSLCGVHIFHNRYRWSERRWFQIAQNITSFIKERMLSGASLLTSTTVSPCWRRIANSEPEQQKQLVSEQRFRKQENCFWWNSVFLKHQVPFFSVGLIDNNTRTPGSRWQHTILWRSGHYRYAV